MNEKPVSFLQLDESAPPRFVGRHRVGLDPVSRGVVKEIRGRIHCLVHVVDGEPWNPGRRFGSGQHGDGSQQGAGQDHNSYTTFLFHHAVQILLGAPSCGKTVAPRVPTRSGGFPAANCGWASATLMSSTLPTPSPS